MASQGKQQQVRQRKGKKKQAEGNKKQNNKPEESSGATTTSTTAGSDSAEQQLPPAQETLWQTFTSHPLVVISPYVLLPYVLYVGYYYLALKRPDLIFFFNARPAVDLYDARQVLIVGPVGSATQHLAATMTNVLKLEISHEATEAHSYFTRDGTVSNFLGIRYADANNTDAEATVKLISEVCIERKGKGSSAHVLQPKSYQPSACPWYNSWSDCHKRECLDLVRAEWGCALSKKGGEDDEDFGSCRTPFIRSIHLVQHPLKSVQELMSKVCPGKAKSAHPAFKQLATVFFNETAYSSCLEAIGWYVVNFHRTMLNARENGAHIDDMIQFEKVTLCDVARIAGFLDPQLVVYQQHQPRLATVCDTPGSDAATKLLPDLVATKGEELVESLPTITWGGINEAGGSSLEEELRKLCEDLGYDPDVMEIQPSKEFGG